MIGCWVDASPVTHRPRRRAGDRLREAGRGAGGARELGRRPTSTCALTIDWKALGLDPARTRIPAPAIESFQPARSFAPTDRIRVDPGRGWLLVLDAR